MAPRWKRVVNDLEGQGKIRTRWKDMQVYSAGDCQAENGAISTQAQVLFSIALIDMYVYNGL